MNSNFTEYLTISARECPDKIAFEDAHESMDYKTLHHDAVAYRQVPCIQGASQEASCACDENIFQTGSGYIRGTLQWELLHCASCHGLMSCVRLFRCVNVMRKKIIESIKKRKAIILTIR